ncbi:MAG: glycosyltransferase [Sphingomonadales bacterium]
MKGELLLVIPTVIENWNKNLDLDADFANNLSAYLEAFDIVTVACPLPSSAAHNNFPNTVTLDSVLGWERVRIIPLPHPYREDRYLRHKRLVVRLLRSEIDRADYLLISPHSAFDWSTLGAELAIEMGRSYDMEADWSLQSVAKSNWSNTKFGPNKLRKYLWMTWHARHYLRCMRHSSVALLQGQDVYEAYKDIAPNPQKVLNVQVTPDDYIGNDELAEKLARIERGDPLIINYAGRVIQMKGPADWVDALVRAAQAGVDFRATWFGEGDLLEQMRTKVAAVRLTDKVSFPGKVDRPVAMASLRASDMFLFTHKTAESPRCLVEALAAACPITGYHSRYAADLVADRGGGSFVPLDDWSALGDTVIALNSDRPRLVQLVRDAYHTAALYDRDAAIAHRIDLIRTYVTPPKR